MKDTIRIIEHLKDQPVCKLVLNLDHGLMILEVSGNTKQKVACIEIENNGPGMDSPASKRIFEPFFTTKMWTNSPALPFGLLFYYSG